MVAAILPAEASFSLRIRACSALLRSVISKCTATAPRIVPADHAQAVALFKIVLRAPVEGLNFDFLFSGNCSVESGSGEPPFVWRKWMVGSRPSAPCIHGFL